MAGMPYYSSHDDDLALSECNIRNLHHLQLIRAVQEVGGKDCFATELSYVCPDLHCRWREGCLGLGAA